jgi:serine/threonine-protein kinase
MFALLTGRSVHEAGTLNETLLLAMSQPAPALVTVWPEAPRLLAALVDRALRYDLNDRWPSASAMRGAVQAARQVRASQPELPRLPMPSQPTLPATPLEAPAAGTVLAAAVSEGAAPAQRSGLTARGRAIVAATLGGALLVVGILLLTLGRGDHGAANVAGTALAPPAASALAALPSASLTPLPPAASSVSADGPTPSASVEIDVSQLPAAPATAPQLAPPAPTPAVVARPSTPAAPAAPPAAKPAATPTSNPLDRRH